MISILASQIFRADKRSTTGREMAGKWLAECTTLLAIVSLLLECHGLKLLVWANDDRLACLEPADISDDLRSTLVLNVHNPVQSITQSARLP